VKADKLDEVDKLFAQLADIDAETFVLVEQINNVQARLGLAKLAGDAVREYGDVSSDENRLFDDLINSVRNLITEANSVLNNTESLLDSVDTSATGTAVMMVGANLAMASQDYATRAGDVSGLEALLFAVRKSLFVIVSNAYDKADTQADYYTYVGKQMMVIERTRLCESGTVTIFEDDRRAEAIFQTNFVAVPQVQYGISGYQFDLRARGAHSTGHGLYGGYGYGSHYGGYGYHYEPNAVGVYVSATPTANSVTFEAINMAFADSDLESVTVSYQACNVGPPLERE